VNYAGELTLWADLKDFDKILAKKFNDDPLKCLDTFEISEERHVIVGSQDQTLTVVKFSLGEVGKNDERTAKFTPIAVLRGHQRSIECVASSADGMRALSGSFDKCLKVWRTEIDVAGDDEDFVHVGESQSKKAKSTAVTKTPMVTLESHREVVVGVKWNPLDKKQAATVSWDHTIILWDLELAGPVRNLNSNKAFTSISLNNLTGLVLTGSTDPVIRLWDLRSHEGSLVKNSFFGHRGWVSDVSWAPDVEHLFVSASFDGTVKMWDIRSPKAALYDLIGFQDRVLSVDWSISKQISGCSVDGTIKTFSRC